MRNRTFTPQRSDSDACVWWGRVPGVTGSAYPLAQRSEWAGGEEAQPHSPDTLVLAIREKKHAPIPIRASVPICSSPLIVARGKYVTCMCLRWGQGRWTKIVTNLTRYMSAKPFWPKWEMGRLRTFKRLGAHAHRELKSPRDLQKARGGRSDLRASYPNPATSGRRGKITHRHPHLPAMESLSPRLRRLVNDQCESEWKHWRADGPRRCHVGSVHQ